MKVYCLYFKNNTTPIGIHIDKEYIKGYVCQNDLFNKIDIKIEKMKKFNYYISEHRIEIWNNRFVTRRERELIAYDILNSIIKNPSLLKQGFDEIAKNERILSKKYIDNKINLSEIEEMMNHFKSIKCEREVCRN